MARFWLPGRLQVGSRMVSKPTPKRSRKRGLLQNRFWDEFGSTLDRSWVDAGPILVDLGVIFGRILGCSIRTCGVLACFSDTSLAFAWCSLGILLTCQVPTFIQMLTEWSKDAPTERAKRAECVRTAYLLFIYYLLNLRGMCVFSDTCFALAWYALGIFTYLCPHSHRCFQTSQEMPLRSERSERSTFVLLTYYLLSICLLLTYYLPVTYYLLIAHVLLTYYVVITHLCSCACLTYPTVLISDLSSSQVFTCKRASRSLLRQVFFALLFGVFCRSRPGCPFLCALGRVQDGSGAQHGPNLGRLWSHVGAILEHVWVFVWLLNLRPFSDPILVDF